MDAHLHRHLDATRGKQLDRCVGAAHQAGGGQCRAVDDGARLEAVQLAEVDHLVLATEAVVEAAQLGQPHRLLHLAALEALGDAVALAGALALLAAAGCLALAGRDAPADTLALLPAARSRLQVMQFHALFSDAAPAARTAMPSGVSAGGPPTLTRGGGLWGTPRVGGEVWWSTLWLSLRNPSAASVAFWSLA